MTHNLSTRLRIITRYTPQDNRRYSRDLGVDAAADAARICLEAGATAEQARDAAAGNPELGPLAEAMERQAQA